MSNLIMCLDLSQPRKKIANYIDDKILSFKMLPEDKKENYMKIIKVVQTAAILTITIATPVQASTMSDKIIHALDPFIELIGALGYPLCTLSLMGGAITMMFNKRLGIKIIKDTAIAYILLQFAPVIAVWLFNLGVEIKKCL